MAEHYDDLLRVAGSLVETAGVRPWCNALIYPELEPGDKSSSMPVSWCVSTRR